MRALAVLATAFVAAAFAAPASGAPNVPSLGKIIEARVPEMLHPKDSPETISAEERYAGIDVSYAKVREFASVHATDGRCLAVGAIPVGALPSGNGNVGIRVGKGAMPLRIERFVGADAGKPELEILDGWIDMTTGGVREARKTRISLSSIGKGVAGYEVFGFRSEGKLHVVFPSSSRFVSVDARGRFGASSCGHIRLILDPEATTGSLVRILGMIDVPQPAKSRRLKEIAQSNLTRGIQASVSVSRTKRDREPLLSVTIGWVEDEQPLLATTIGEAEVVEAPQISPRHIDDDSRAE